jgi:hypothetical protein
VARWSIPIAELCEKYKQRIDLVIRMTTAELFKRVVLRTPVDTGRARANWNVSYGQIDYSISSTVDPTGDGKSRMIDRQLRTMYTGGIVYLTNSLPYIGALEYGLYPNPPKMGSQKRGESGPTIHVSNGYSMQAPHGMVRITIQEFDAAVRRAIEAAP